MSDLGIYEPTPEDKEKYKDYSLVILTPCGSYFTHAKFCKSLADLIAYSWHCGLKIYKVGIKERMVVHWARNDLADQALKIGNIYTGEPYTHLLWLDDDMVFSPDLAVYLARNGDKDMVSALYYGRNQHVPVVYRKEEGEKDEMKHQQWVSVGPKMFQVDAVGYGCLLARREVYEKLPHPWFKFDGGGEDIYFCVQAKKIGIEIWCDASYHCGHIGDQHVITHTDHMQYLEDHKDEFSDGLLKVDL